MFFYELDFERRAGADKGAGKHGGHQRQRGGDEVCLLAAEDLFKGQHAYAHFF